MQLDTAQVSGGCDAKAMCDQGRTSTSGITVTQLSKGTASADPVSQATRTVAGGSRLEDSTNSTEKRKAVFLMLHFGRSKLAETGLSAVRKKEPYRARGSLPRAQQSRPEGDSDLQYWLDNYSTYNEHRADADAILAKEREKGWLEGCPTRAPLDLMYGTITPNRSDVGCPGEKAAEGAKLSGLRSPPAVAVINISARSDTDYHQ